MPLLIEASRERVVAAQPALPRAGGGGFAPVDSDGFGGGDDDDHDDRGARGPIDPRDWVTLATFWHAAHAHIARLRLEAAGVPCVLLDELMAGAHVFALAVGGVKLKVPRPALARAALLLRDHERAAGARAVAESPTVLLAAFERVLDAKAAACVIEAAGLRCEVVEHVSTAPRPTWVAWLPRSWRTRLWPAASVSVDRREMIHAVAALRSTPYGRRLSYAARRGPCAGCHAGADWAVWQLDWQSGDPSTTAPNDGAARAVPRMALPRLVRRCARCGHSWQ